MSASQVAVLVTRNTVLLHDGQMATQLLPRLGPNDLLTTLFLLLKQNPGSLWVDNLYNLLPLDQDLLDLFRKVIAQLLVKNVRSIILIQLYKVLVIEVKLVHLILVLINATQLILLKTGVQEASVHADIRVVYLLLHHRVPLELLRPHLQLLLRRLRHRLLLLLLLLLFHLEVEAVEVSVDVVQLLLAAETVVVLLQTKQELVYYQPLVGLHAVQVD